MQSYVEFVNEYLMEKGLQNITTGKVNGIFINFTNHSLERHEERSDSLSETDWEKILIRITNDIRNKKEGYYLYFSKSYNQGVVLYYDRKRQDKIFIVTILPKGKAYAKDKTSFQLVESLAPYVLKWEMSNLDLQVHESVFMLEEVEVE